MAGPYPNDPGVIPGTVQPGAVAAGGRGSVNANANQRAEAFLGYAVHSPEQIDLRSKLDAATIRKLVDQRRTGTALRALSAENDLPAAVACDLRVRCLVALRRYDQAVEECQQGISTLGTETPFSVRLTFAILPLLQNPGGQTPNTGVATQVVGRVRELMHGRTVAEKIPALRWLSHACITSGHAADVVADVQAAIAGAEDNVEETIALRSLLGRHLLSIGDVDLATAEFERVESLAQGTCVAKEINAGLLALTKDDYMTARDRFFALTQTPELSSSSSSGVAASESVIDVVTTVTNNLAVCCLYTKEMRRGIDVLEGLVKRDPVAYMQPCVIKNLGTLYELFGDAPARRASLRAVAQTLGIEDLDQELFKSG